MGVDASSFTKKVDSATLKLDVDKWDNDSLRTVSTNWKNVKTKVNKLDVDKLKQFQLLLKTLVMLQIKILLKIMNLTNLNQKSQVYSLKFLV